jgi:hypothetical protein
MPEKHQSMNSVERFGFALRGPSLLNAAHQTAAHSVTPFNYAF